MSVPLFPFTVLANNIAIIGKTGSGKSVTAKLVIEQVVPTGARVCILDPIKSDWWGLTLDADGRRPGLPFQILGGPRGHVPLTSSAGKAIGELVASGALKLSIVDMKDFEPGGVSRFFVDFCTALSKRMRGIVYLVLEEAHLFAPKERSGIGNENMAIHWAKTLATAGRTLGIRLIVCTQRTQALHNAILGSCETLIAHRLTAPADQAPVLKWLQANAPKDIAGEVGASLARLKTGTGWIVSGETSATRMVEFPLIHTYDNTATPSDDDGRHDVKVPAVDTDALRAIIGSAVAEAEANDPAKLKAKIAELERAIKKPATVGTAPAGMSDDGVRGLVAQAEERGRALGKIDGGRIFAEMLRQRLPNLERAVETVAAIIREGDRPETDYVIPSAPLLPVDKPVPVSGLVARPTRQPFREPRPAAQHQGNGAPVVLPKGEHVCLVAVAQHRGGVTRDQLSILTGYKRSTRNAYVDRLGARDYITISGPTILATPAGISALGRLYEPLPTGDDLRRHWLERLPEGERAILEAVAAVYPSTADRETIGEHTGYKRSTRNAYIQRLAARKLVVDQGGGIRAAEELFG